jgi:hypothetical protein
MVPGVRKERWILEIKDRDDDGIINASSADWTGMTPKSRMQISDHAWFVGYSMRRPNEVHASTSFGDNGRDDMIRIL